MIRTATLSCLMLLASGCATTLPVQESEQQPAASPPANVKIATWVAGQSVNGAPIHATALTGAEGDDPSGDAQVILLLGAIHGDEQAGTALLGQLVEHLRAHPDLLANRTVLVVPVANPDGVAANTRENANAVDLNRNFPASNYVTAKAHGSGPLSEPETQALFSLVNVNGLSRVVSIHQCSGATGLIDFDGPAGAIALDMSLRGELGVKRLGGRPGSLGSYVGSDRKLPVVTLELHEGDQHLTADQLWERYGAVLIAAIRFGSGAPMEPAATNAPAAAS